MILFFRRPQKIAGNLSDPQNSGNFAKPRKICQPRKIGNKILTCAPLGFELGRLCPGMGIFVLFLRPGGRSFALNSCPGGGDFDGKISGPGGGW